MDQTRDQKRAVYAYACVDEVTEGWDDYEGAVMSLGATILRSGLAAAMSELERLSGKWEEAEPERLSAKQKAARQLRCQLAAAGVPGLANANGRSLPGEVRALPRPAYLLASRELLKVATWFRRAVQARAAAVPERAGDNS